MASVATHIAMASILGWAKDIGGESVTIFCLQEQVKLDAAILDGLIKRMLPDIHKQFMVIISGK